LSWRAAFAPNFHGVPGLRALFGIGKGGEWGVALHCNGGGSTEVRGILERHVCRVAIRSEVLAAIRHDLLPMWDGGHVWIGACLRC